MHASKLALAALVLSLPAIDAGCVHPQPRRSSITDSSALSLKQRRLVGIAVFTANGELSQLGTALNEALDARWTISEIKEVLLQMYAYAGFPRSLNGINTFMDVLDQRRTRGIVDEVGRDPSPMPAGKTSIEVGAEMLEKLGATPTGRHLTFAPAIGAFLKGHLFGDIIARDNLDVHSRELATIAALATIDRVDPQLASHFNVGLNTGLSEAQLRGLATVVAELVDEKHGNHASHILAEALTKRRGGKPAAPIAAVTPPVLELYVEKHAARSIEIAPAEHFIGVGHVERLFASVEPSRASGASVLFEPGARTAWHSHPLGQRLIVTGGTGWVQQWGKPKQTIEVGDVVTIPPNVKHWHGATATTSMTHIAVQEQLDGKTADWMEEVSATQYGAEK